MGKELADRMILQIAKIIFNNEITINDLYSVLGIDLEDVAHSDPDNVVAHLAGILDGWNNPPSSE